jgi:hypothetical protein
MAAIEQITKSPSPRERLITAMHELWSSPEKLSSLITAANWGIATTLLVAFACTAVVVKATSQKDALTRALDLAKAQHIAELDNANLTLRGQVATLEIAASTADVDLAELRKKAAEAETTQQQVQIDLAKQKERAAAAEEAASNAALALAKFKEPRTLSPEHQDALVAALKQYSGQFFAFAVFPDPESLSLLRTLDVNLKSAGWKRVPSQIDRVGGVLVETAGETAATIFDSGIDVYIAPDDTESVPAQSAICLALRNAGISCETHRTPQLSGKTPRAITLSIGKKP